MCCVEVFDTSTISSLGPAGPIPSTGAAPQPMTLAPNGPNSLDPALQVAIPDIANMQAALKSGGSLLSEIKVSDTSNSPLSHLQPNHLVQTPEGPKPAYVLTAQPITSQVIQLASTAPQLSVPTPAVVNNAHQHSEHQMLSGIVTVLTITSVAVVGWFIYSQYAAAQEMNAGETGPLQQMINNLPFVVTDQNNQPSAAWYQEQ